MIIKTAYIPPPVQVERGPLIVGLPRRGPPPAQLPPPKPAPPAPRRRTGVYHPESYAYTEAFADEDAARRAWLDEQAPTRRSRKT